MPGGVLVTVPFPVLFTVSTGLRVKEALTDFATSIETLQVVAPPEQPPVQPEKSESGLGVTVRKTVVGGEAIAYASEQSAPQSIPAGLLLTVPLPVPDLVMVRTGLRLNLTVTTFDALIKMVQETPFVLSHPVQAIKSELAAAPAVRTTWVVRLV